MNQGKILVDKKYEWLLIKFDYNKKMKEVWDNNVVLNKIKE